MLVAITSSTWPRPSKAGEVGAPVSQLELPTEIDARRTGREVEADRPAVARRRHHDDPVADGKVDGVGENLEDVRQVRRTQRAEVDAQADVDDMGAHVHGVVDRRRRIRAERPSLGIDQAHRHQLAVPAGSRHAFELPRRGIDVVGGGPDDPRHHRSVRDPDIGEPIAVVVDRVTDSRIAGEADSERRRGVRDPLAAAAGRRDFHPWRRGHRTDCRRCRRRSRRRGRRR